MNNIISNQFCHSILLCLFIEILKLKTVSPIRTHRWSECGDSNPGPPAPKAGALPTAQHPDVWFLFFGRALPPPLSELSRNMGRQPHSARFVKGIIAHTCPKSHIARKRFSGLRYKSPTPSPPPLKTMGPGFSLSVFPCTVPAFWENGSIRRTPAHTWPRLD